MEVMYLVTDLYVEGKAGMDKKELDRLLNRSKNGSISEEEATKLDNWYISFEDLDNYTEGMRIKEQDAVRRSMLSSIQKEIEMKCRTACNNRNVVKPFFQNLK